ncbi:MAG: YdcF family protein [Chloroflexi bacterium]|nr:YdcF family protein [Chloroflexota bacterium]
MKRRFFAVLRRLWRIVSTLFILWLCFACLLACTVYLYGSVDRKQPANVIIVLGAGLRRDGRPDLALTRRSQHAAQLWQQGYAPYVLCTGGQSEYVRRAEAAGCRDVLLANGVPDPAIVLEAQSRSTEENAIYAGDMMAARGWQSAVLVTDGFHLLRAAWIFGQRGVNVFPSPVAFSRVPAGWLGVYLAREILALHWQVFKGIFNLPNTYVGGL